MATLPRARRLARQLYVDLVRRRARVRIFEARTGAGTEQPVFLLGPYRSGTTLLRYLVDSHSRIACPPESDFLAVLNGLVGRTRSGVGLESMGFDRSHVNAKIRELAGYFYGNYAHSLGKPRWADKSPTYVDHLPFLRELFPGAQFVFIHRHPLDQIHSHTRGGTHTNAFIDRHRGEPDDGLLAAGARYWRNSTATILEFANTDTASHQLRYEDLCADPPRIARELFGFLGEPWEESVLDYHNSPHDLGMEAARTRSAKGFDVSTGGYIAWPEPQRRRCIEIVEPTARRLGYDLAGPTGGLVQHLRSSTPHGGTES